MVVTLLPGADPGKALRELRALGLWVETLHGGSVPMLRVTEGSRRVAVEAVRAVTGVAEVAVPDSPHPLVDAQVHVVDVAGIRIGPGQRRVVMAGPCSVESETQIHSIAAQLHRLGVSFLRGGAYKPRSSPYTFDGYREQALEWLIGAARANDLKIVTECLAAASAEAVAECADLVQIGSRNMQNYDLLRAAGETRKPILLKRGMAATIEEWLLAGEHCLHHGAAAVIFCERGVRGFDPSTRGLLDLGAAALIGEVLGMPIVVDPSHAAGRRDLVPALSRAALAAGAHGLLIETHDDPGAALSDGPQAIPLAELAELLSSLDL